MIAVARKNQYPREVCNHSSNCSVPKNCWVITDLDGEIFFSDKEMGGVFVYSEQKFAQRLAEILELESFLIVHYVWNKLIKKLREQKFRCVIVDFPKSYSSFPKVILI